MIHRRAMIGTSLIATTACLASNRQSRAQTEQTPNQLDPALVKQFVAVSHGRLATVKELVAKEPQLVTASWDWVDGDWETGLGAASHVGNRDIANYLLDHGARIDVFAMAMLGQTKVVQAILETSPKIHAVAGPHGIPLLSHAIVGGEEAKDVFTALLAAGADVNQASNAGQTPLMAAAMQGRVELVEALVQQGADLTIQDGNQKTAEDMARERKHAEVVAILQRAAKN